MAVSISKYIYIGPVSHSTSVLKCCATWISFPVSSRVFKVYHRRKSGTRLKQVPPYFISYFHIISFQLSAELLIENRSCVDMDHLPESLLCLWKVMLYDVTLPAKFNMATQAMRGINICPGMQYLKHKWSFNQSTLYKLQAHEWKRTFQNTEMEHQSDTNDIIEHKSALSGPVKMLPLLYVERHLFQDLQSSSLRDAFTKYLNVALARVSKAYIL